MTTANADDHADALVQVCLTPAVRANAAPAIIQLNGISPDAIGHMLDPAFITFVSSVLASPPAAAGTR